MLLSLFRSHVFGFPEVTVSQKSKRTVTTKLIIVFALSYEIDVSKTEFRYFLGYPYNSADDMLLSIPDL